MISSRSGRARHALFAFWLALSCALGVGCSRGDGELDAEALRELGGLPGATQAAHPALREELARIEGEAGLPRQLGGTLAPEQNLSLVLSELYDPEKLPLLAAELERDFPAERFTFSPLALAKAVRLRTAHEAALTKLAAALASPQNQFAIDYERGFYADRGFIDACRVSLVLESYRAAEHLADDRLPEALAALRTMFALTSRLAAVKHVEARLEAATLRARSLAVLQAIMAHPRVTRAEVAVARQLVQEQLAAWPYDGDAWSGDRAQALHGYELVRAGAVMQLLTPEEREMLAADGQLADFATAAARRVDDDQLYYLTTLRSLIDACGKPFFERRALFAKLRHEQDARKNDPDFPLVAVRLLLPGIESGQRLQAEDRAWTEVWALALSLALGLPRPPAQVDPVTGNPYHVSIEAMRVTVWSDGLPERAALVPVLEESGKRKAALPRGSDATFSGARNVPRVWEKAVSSQLSAVSQRKHEARSFRTFVLIAFDLFVFWCLPFGALIFMRCTIPQEP